MSRISPPAKPVSVSTYSGPLGPQSIYISGRYAYVADFANGLYVLDISNPANVTLAGQKSGTGYYSVQVAGDYAYAGDALRARRFRCSTSMTPSNITTVGSLSTGGNPRSVFLAGKYAYESMGNTTLKVVDINGAKLPAANIGSLAANTA